MTDRDPRLTPARPDLAAESLRGIVAAERYAAPRRLVVSVPLAPLTRTPDGEAEMATQLLMGEGFDAYETRGGWAWGQSVRDGYVGYVPDACLSPEGAPAGWRVTALHAIVYPEPRLRARPVGVAPFGARLAGAPDRDGFHRLAEGGYAPSVHLAPADSREPDWVAVAERLLGAPYLWGGRSPAGIDCSGLVQVARQAAGLACPRDSDMQREAAGETVAAGAERRGDLICWRGHIGIMVSDGDLLHANAHHMAVAREPLGVAEARIAAAGLPVLARRRWDG
jgi:hypothetical protein